VADNARDQEKLREQHRSKAADRTLVSLEEARRRRTPLDWKGYQPPRPSFTGARAFAPVPLEEIVPFIDWTPFFATWELPGTYPKIFESPTRGAEARQLYDDARRLLDRIVREGRLTAKAVVGFYPANAVGDDIELYADESRARPLAILRTLRQQTARPDAMPLQALADFVAPRDTGIADYVGGFAVTAGHGTDALVAEFARDHDDYQGILAKALADRLAEARPAPGYPACPDHTEKGVLFELLGAEAATGIRLTESYAMTPPASVSGLFFSHPEARYFTVGPLGRDQVLDYQRRKGLALGEVERWLAPNLAYDPQGAPVSTPVREPARA
jgi:5-methyltetrahydrofolate--homocysteine methyltransferase